MSIFSLFCAGEGVSREDESSEEVEILDSARARATDIKLQLVVL